MPPFHQGRAAELVMEFFSRRAHRLLRTNGAAQNQFCFGNIRRNERRQSEEFLQFLQGSAFQQPRAARSRNNRINNQGQVAGAKEPPDFPNNGCRVKHSGLAGRGCEPAHYTLDLLAHHPRRQNVNRFHRRWILGRDGRDRARPMHTERSECSEVRFHTSPPAAVRAGDGQGDRSELVHIHSSEARPVCAKTALFSKLIYRTLNP